MSLSDLSQFGARPPAAVTPEPARPLRRAATRSRRRFLVWNGCCFVAVVVLPLTPGSGVATDIVGGLTVSMAAFLAQAVLLLATARRFDRDCRTHCDPLTAPTRTDGAGR
ncbi:hypothetical protein [Streptacidiphilus sp. PAMC 29251]